MITTCLSHLHSPGNHKNGNTFGTNFHDAQCVPHTRPAKELTATKSERAAKTAIPLARLFTRSQPPARIPAIESARPAKPARPARSATSPARGFSRIQAPLPPNTAPAARIPARIPATSPATNPARSYRRSSNTLSARRPPSLLRKIEIAAKTAKPHPCSPSPTFALTMVRPPKIQEIRPQSYPGSISGKHSGNKIGNTSGNYVCRTIRSTGSGVRLSSLASHESKTRKSAFSTTKRDCLQKRQEFQQYLRQCSHSQNMASFASTGVAPSLTLMRCAWYIYRNMHLRTVSCSTIRFTRCNRRRWFRTVSGPGVAEAPRAGRFSYLAPLQPKSIQHNKSSY
jgi:hypothetical protein